MINDIDALKAEAVEIDSKIDQAAGHINDAINYIKKHVTDETVKEDLCDNILKYALEELTSIEI